MPLLTCWKKILKVVNEFKAVLMYLEMVFRRRNLSPKQSRTLNRRSKIKELQEEITDIIMGNESTMNNIVESSERVLEMLEELNKK